MEEAAVLLIGAELPGDRDFAHAMAELRALAEATGLTPAADITQRLERPVAATLFGSGKLAEIKETLSWLPQEISAVVCENTLTPMQHKNLSKFLEIEVIDRTGLILMIFAERARTHEAKLQVEAAQLNYLLPRLAGLHQGLSRQGGASGSLSGKGPGEKQIELDRRRIERRINELRGQLADMKRDRAVQRNRRLKEGIPRVSLVGYTNAGKSTIMNGLLALGTNVAESSAGSGWIAEKQVFAEDMLFATLDTTVRRIHPGGSGRDFLLSDTVGFIEHLPTMLVQAFRSTLEEACFADLLLIVVDISDAAWQVHIKTTLETLAEIGADKIPRLFVFNKADLLTERIPGRLSCEHLSPEDRQIILSAKGAGEMEHLCGAIEAALCAGSREYRLCIPYTKGALLHDLQERYETEIQDYTPEGTLIRAMLPPEIGEKYAGL